jgi:hypothetical protein
VSFEELFEITHWKFLINHRKTSTSLTGKLLKIFTGNWSPTTTHPLNTGAFAPRCRQHQPPATHGFFGSPATLGFLPQSLVFSLFGSLSRTSASLTQSPSFSISVSLFSLIPTTSPYCFILQLQLEPRN